MQRRDTMAAMAISGLALMVMFVAGPCAAQVPSAAQLQNPELENTPKLKPGANSFVESQARDLLERDGYSNVSSLMNGQDGIWYGKAVKDRKTFDVSVDYQGHIAAK